MTWEVKDGVTTYRINGIKLAESSSYDYTKPRWVEYTLFKATTGQWIWSRVGKSLLYHGADCPTVTRNRLGKSEPSIDGIPCEICKPSRYNPEGLYPETDRPKIQVCDSADIVLATLSQRDVNGAQYLTNVVKDLLEQASEIDSDIYNVYMVRTVG